MPQHCYQEGYKVLEDGYGESDGCPSWQPQFDDPSFPSHGNLPAYKPQMLGATPVPQQLDRPPDGHESRPVAVQCLAAAFGVDADTPATKSQDRKTSDEAR